MSLVSSLLDLVQEVGADIKSAFTSIADETTNRNTALDLKADLTYVDYELGLKADKQYVEDEFIELLDSTPEVLDTLNELAAALGDDANYAVTTSTLIGQKANSADVYTKAESDSSFASTQSTLVSGSNLRTVNGETLLGSTDINVQVYRTDKVIVEAANLMQTHKTMLNFVRMNTI
jgi:hypothetical protein